MVTIFKNIYSKEPHYITVEKSLVRIQSGKSKELIAEIRQQLDKERADKLKLNLPAVCFSGKFSERKDEALIEHSGFIVLDFDNLEDVRTYQVAIISRPYIYACWVSPRGNGLKALVKIAKHEKHREHFSAIREDLPDADKSGVNVSRVCYESYDPDIYINTEAEVFTKLVKAEKIQVQVPVDDKSEVYGKILRWLTNRGDAFVSGERNAFIFKLASACCRFGISEQEATTHITNDFLTQDSSFAYSEATNAIKSAYKRNNFATAIFEKDVLIDSKTKSEVQIDAAIFDLSVRPKDVIFGEDVKDLALDIYDNGYKLLPGIGCELDEYFKLKRCEISLLTGIGNYGKSSFLMWYLLCRSLRHGEKFALFSPENNPAHEFYHELTEIYLGADCTPQNYQRPSKMAYEQAYDAISKRIFYVYPKDIAPSPDYIKERFLELVIKEKVDGCIIDPFNQLANDYGSAGGRSDKYLETFLSDCARFAQTNNIFFMIVAHPKMLRKEADGNYPCPDVFDIADGAMWNNKMDNILVYHRPNHQKDPQSTICELHTKKIRRQRQVGKKGTLEFEYFRRQRRFYVNGSDVLGKLLVPAENKIEFESLPF